MNMWLEVTAGCLVVYVESFDTHLFLDIPALPLSAPLHCCIGLVGYGGRNIESLSAWLVATASGEGGATGIFFS